MQSLLDGRLFAQEITAYGFGVDAKRTAAALRRVADALETKEILLQKANVYTSLRQDHFPMCGLVLQLVEMLEGAPDRKELRANGEKFPIDSAPASTEAN